MIAERHINNLREGAKNLDQIARAGERVFSPTVLGNLADIALCMRECIDALPAQPSQAQAVEIKPVAYEFQHLASGHAIVDYSRDTYVGHLTEEKGYVAMPLVYASPPASPVASSNERESWIDANVSGNPVLVRAMKNIALDHDTSPSSEREGCQVEKYSSRVCELGTKSCDVYHNERAVLTDEYVASVLDFLSNLICEDGIRNPEYNQGISDAAYKIKEIDSGLYRNAFRALLAARTRGTNDV